MVRDVALASVQLISRRRGDRAPADLEPLNAPLGQRVQTLLQQLKTARFVLGGMRGTRSPEPHPQRDHKPRHSWPLAARQPLTQNAHPTCPNAQVPRAGQIAGPRAHTMTDPPHAPAHAYSAHRAGPSQSRSVIAAAGPASGRRPLADASRAHTASDVLVILKAGRPARAARHERASPLIIDPCPDKQADNTAVGNHSQGAGQLSGRRWTAPGAMLDSGLDINHDRPAVRASRSLAPVPAGIRKRSRPA